MTSQSKPDLRKRIQRWCGICFAWREQGDEGRCTACGNAHMTGEAIPLTSDEEQARAGHERVVAALKNGEDPDA